LLDCSTTFAKRKCISNCGNKAILKTSNARKGELGFFFFQLSFSGPWKNISVTKALKNQFFFIFRKIQRPETGFSKLQKTFLRFCFIENSKYKKTSDFKVAS